MTQSYTAGAAAGGTDIEQYCDAVRILPEMFATDRGSGHIVAGVDGEYDVPDKDTGTVDVTLSTWIKKGAFHTNKSIIAALLFDKTIDVYLGRTNQDGTTVEMLVRPIGNPFDGGPQDRFNVSWPLRAVKPFWRNQTQRTSVNPVASITVAGDGHVADAVFTFTGGTTPVLTNNTNGDVLTLTGSPGGTAVIVDVGARTVTRGGSDWDANFDPNKQRWMRLEPGVNSMSLTGGGSVAVDLYEKYR